MVYKTRYFKYAARFLLIRKGDHLYVLVLERTRLEVYRVRNVEEQPQGLNNFVSAWSCVASILLLLQNSTQSHEWTVLIADWRSERIPCPYLLLVDFWLADRGRVNKNSYQNIKVYANNIANIIPFVRGTCAVLTMTQAAALKRKYVHIVSLKWGTFIYAFINQFSHCLHFCFTPCLWFQKSMQC